MRQYAGGRGAREPCAGKRQRRKQVALQVHLQCVEPDLRSGIAPIRGKQPRLERQQAQGRQRVNADVRGLSGVGVQAGGQIDSQHRRIGVAHVCDPLCHPAFGCTRGADAQQGVHAQVETVRRCGGE